MTDPPIQVWSRYIAIDIHKHYLMIGGRSPPGVLNLQRATSVCGMRPSLSSGLLHIHFFRPQDTVHAQWRLSI